MNGPTGSLSSAHIRRLPPNALLQHAGTSPRHTTCSGHQPHPILAAHTRQLTSTACHGLIGSNRTPSVTVTAPDDACSQPAPSPDSIEPCRLPPHLIHARRPAACTHFTHRTVSEHATAPRQPSISRPPNPSLPRPHSFPPSQRVDHAGSPLTSHPRHSHPPPHPMPPGHRQYSGTRYRHLSMHASRNLFFFKHFFFFSLLPG